MPQPLEKVVPVMEYGKKYACESKKDGSFGYAIYSEVPQCVSFRFWGDTLKKGMDLNSGTEPKLITLWIGRPSYLINSYNILGEWTEADQARMDAVALEPVIEEIVYAEKPVTETVKPFTRPPELGQMTLL